MTQDRIGRVSTTNDSDKNAFDFSPEPPGSLIQLDDQNFLGEANCILSEAEADFVMVVCYSDSKFAWVPGRSGKFLIIYVIDKSGYRKAICKTNKIHINSNPSWEPISLSRQKVGDEDTVLLIKLFNFKRNGKHVLKGEIRTSVRHLEQLHQQQEAAIFTPPDDSGKKSGKRKLSVNEFTRRGQSSQ